MKFIVLIAFVLCPFLATSGAAAPIQSGKSIQISISGVPEKDRSEITGLYPVAETGTINLPHLGQVRAAGLVTTQLQESLQDLFKRAGVFTNPTIQVIDTTDKGAVNHETVVVGGQVRDRGMVPFSKELTLWGAIQAAGGATEFGSMHRVKLMRDGKTTKLDATRPEVMQMLLLRNDSIEVPQKNWRGW